MADSDRRTSPPGRVILLAGPSGSGKSHLARESGLPVLCLDEFYKDGDDPSLPCDEHLGTVDWEDPAAWDAEAALSAIESICRTGSAEVPTYDISQDRATGSVRFDRGEHQTYVAEGIFVAEIVRRCRDADLLADAIAVQRPPWKNFARRLVRDLSEHRKPPLTLLRRGLALLRKEVALVDSLTSAGCRPLSAKDTRKALAEHQASGPIDSS